MRNFKTVKTIQNTVCLTSIICNKCGKEIKQENEKDVSWRDRAIEFNIEFGYGNKYDLETWSFDLCEDCIGEIINNFIIPVTDSNLS